VKISDERLNYHIANVEECAEVDGTDDLYDITVGEMAQILERLQASERTHESTLKAYAGYASREDENRYKLTGAGWLDENGTHAPWELVIEVTNDQLNLLLDLPTTVHKAPEVTPDDMVRYLEANGYIKHGDNIKSNGHENAFSYYIHKDDKEAEGVWVPLRNEFDDWKSRCIDAMRAMASSMGKTQLRVWYELTMITKKEGPN
jgi:hypothetical protein